MRGRLLGMILLVAALGLAITAIARPRPASTKMKLEKAVAAPGNPLRFDISWVDESTGRYYLGEAGNASVDVFDARNLTFLGRIGGFHGAPAANDPCGRIEGMGPSGVVVTPDEKLWATDAKGTVKEFDLAGSKSPSSLKPVATVTTGAICRADEIGYDPKDHVIMVGNPGEADLKPYRPPFASFISADEHVEVLGKIVFSTKDGFAFNAEGLEQPLWVPALDRFLVPVQGESEGLLAVIKVDKAAKKFTVEKTYKTPNCNGSGLALGPSGHLLVGCDDGHPLLIVNVENGQVLKTIPEIHGSDEVWYNHGDHHFYAAAGGPPVPAVGVIDAATNEFLENLPTGPGAHSVAADAKTNYVFAPIGAPNPKITKNACVTSGLPAANGCVAVYSPEK
jgi:DNA-binding beta-propeller fold protein YncE